jgi:RHS repeat-associated protein
VTYADGSSTTYTYDAGNRLTQITDSVSGTITRTYDGLNRLTSETTPQGSVSYTYDAAGRRASMTVAGQPTTNYAYDDMNRLTQITQGSSVVSFGYDAASRRTSLTLPNGILINYGYDAASRVTSITYKQGTTVLGDLIYGYDSAGNHTNLGGSWARTGIPQAVSSTNYNSANHQLTFDDKTLTYDTNGNLKTITDGTGTTIYSWSARNQLNSISSPAVNANFVYDGFGRREKKTINGSLTEFFYDGINPVQETSGTTVLANTLSGLGIDEFLTRTDVIAATTNQFLADALGSAIALADSTGSPQTEYTYEPFGKVTATGASMNNPLQYTERENDGTGLYYYRARYYSPEMKRFVSEDPIEFYGGDVNLYAYVGNNPLNFVDQLGLSRKDCGSINILIGSGFSAILGGGVEGAAGVIINRDDIGIFSSLGGGYPGQPGGGINVSAEFLLFGYITGNPRGWTTNYNYVVGPLSVTVFTDPATKQKLGGTIGFGPIFGPIPIGASLTQSHSVATVRDLIDYISSNGDRTDPQACR